jgi:hypothetical protein
VALHPEYFLPHGSMLTIYDPSTSNHKHYVAARDQRLRESPDPSSRPLPPFQHVSEDRVPGNRLNIFLVIINAEIKFRRYFEMVQPTTPLPDDVLNLMHSTIHLVNLLYWEPQLKKGSPRETVMAASRRENPLRNARPGPKTVIERASEEGIVVIASSSRGSGRRQRR